MGGARGALRGPEGVVLACLFMLHDRHPCSCNVRCRSAALNVLALREKAAAVVPDTPLAVGISPCFLGAATHV